MHSFRYLAIAAFATTLAVAMRAQQPPDAKRTFGSPADYVADLSATPATASELRDLVDRFSQDRQAIQRFYTIQGSTTRRERLWTFYDAWLAKLPAIRFDNLSLEGKVDYVLLRNRIEYERALLGREERVRRETGELVPFYDDVAGMQEERQRLAFVDADAAVSDIRRVAAKVDAVRARVAGGLTAPPAVAVRAAEQVDLLNTALAQWFNFYNGYDPQFTAAVPAAYQSLKTRWATTPRCFARKSPACRAAPDNCRRRRADVEGAAAPLRPRDRAKDRSSVIRSAGTVCWKTSAEK